MLSQIRSYLWRFRHSSRARAVGRRQLKAAKNGDTEQFLCLAAAYLDLTNCYFGSTYSETESDRNARTEKVFVALWQQLGYTERLSDFEFILASLLFENTSSYASITSNSAIVIKMRLLEPKVRFALIAYELENWPLRYLSLVMRLKHKALHALLAEARCELCGISWESLALDERKCLQAISMSQDKNPNIQTNRQLKNRTAIYPRISNVRAQWLEMKPELVEVKMRYKSNLINRELILKNLLESTNQTSIIRPAIVDRMVNTMHFSRYSKIKIS